MIEVGALAPNFTLRGVHNGEIQTYTLRDYTEQGPVLLGVYVYDFSPMCTTQMCQLTDMDWYKYKNDLSIFGIATDGPYSHMKFAEQEGIGFPLLCDTTGAVLQQYDVLYEEKDGLKNVPQRSLFLIDEEQRVTYRWVADDNWNESDFGTNPVEDALKQL